MITTAVTVLAVSSFVIGGRCLISANGTRKNGLQSIFHLGIIITRYRRYNYGKKM